MIAGMPRAQLSIGIELEYDTFGDPADPALILVMGLGTQMVAWHPRFCGMLADHGLFVVRFDNRDCGLSTRLEDMPVDVVGALQAAVLGEPVTSPYTLSHLADDVAGLLDYLELDGAHIAGVSLGGMIAQTFAIEHRERTTTLTSIMSSPDLMAFSEASPEAIALLFTPRPTDDSAALEAALHSGQVLAGEFFDERAVLGYERAASQRGGAYPMGTARQLCAIFGSGSREEMLRQLKVPTLVIHGEADPLIPPSAGRRTAELIPGAELMMVEKMGHDLPMPLWPLLTDRIGEFVRST
ncbi:MAG TPA: alpha/beta hydrolase [Acidimicrobiia bacterium]|nr:alpha/beta hydrolase [Acidimicrobiia bacterium]